MEKRLHWEEAPLNERLKICAFYAQVLKQQGIDMTAEQISLAWYGCWFDVIKFTFSQEYYR